MPRRTTFPLMVSLLLPAALIAESAVDGMRDKRLSDADRIRDKNIREGAEIHSSAPTIDMRVFDEYDKAVAREAAERARKQREADALERRIAENERRAAQLAAERQSRQLDEARRQIRALAARIDAECADFTKRMNAGDPAARRALILATLDGGSHLPPLRAGEILDADGMEKRDLHRRLGVIDLPSLADDAGTPLAFLVNQKQGYGFDRVSRIAAATSPENRFRICLAAMLTRLAEKDPPPHTLVPAWRDAVEGVLQGLASPAAERAPGSPDHALTPELAALVRHAAATGRLRLSPEIERLVADTLAAPASDERLAAAIRRYAAEAKTPAASTDRPVPLAPDALADIHLLLVAARDPKEAREAVGKAGMIEAPWTAHEPTARLYKTAYLAARAVAVGAKR